MEYMSQEGYDKLVAELRQLESVELPQVRDAIAEARDKGDLSENFEYHAAKREQGRLLSRCARHLSPLCRQCWSAQQGRDDQRKYWQSHELHHCQSPRGQPPRRQDFHQVTHRPGPA